MSSAPSSFTSTTKLLLPSALRLVIALAVSTFVCRATNPEAKKVEEEKRPSTDPLVKTLLEASYVGDLTGVRDGIFLHGVNTEVHDDMGWTALNLASLAGHLSIVQFLVGVGANVESQEVFGQTPVGSAAINGHSEVVDYLLSVDPPANVTHDDLDGAQPLHYAAQYGFDLICQSLLRAGALVDATTERNGWTPLHAACASGHAAVVKVLVDWKAQTDIVDHSDRTPWHVIGETRPLTRRLRMIIQCLLDPNAAVERNPCRSIDEHVFTLDEQLPSSSQEPIVED